MNKPLFISQKIWGPYFSIGHRWIYWDLIIFGIDYGAGVKAIPIGDIKVNNGESLSADDDPKKNLNLTPGLPFIFSVGLSF